ncbi:MAG TPA: TPM domain-containing protein [Chitinophagales bacterium]|nr:TPM domain-containing protein [Chitinophagales bacterium]
MPKVKQFFSQPEKIVDAIKQTESTTSGEIKVHVESENNKEVMLRAQEVFLMLDMHLLPQKNGVLIYISVRDKEICIIGDKNIHNTVGHNFWNDTVYKMSQHFKNRQFDTGTIEAILEIGQKLKIFFPFDHTTKSNDLSDDISYGE